MDRPTTPLGVRSRERWRVAGRELARAMDLGLHGRTAIVAAASQGLGRAVAAALAAEGAGVVLFSHNRDAAERAAAEIRTSAGSGARVLGLEADGTREEDLERVVNTTLEQFGRVDILYNNMPGPRTGRFEELSDEDWDRAYRLNLLSAVRLTRLCLPSMRQHRWGRIITGTSSSVKQPIATLMLSNSMRSAVTAWSKTLSDEVARDGITVNTLAPGRIETMRTEELDADAARRRGISVDEIRAERSAAIPMGRYGTPEEFAAAAAFLASEPARFITGVTLLVDGGQLRSTY